MKADGWIRNKILIDFLFNSLNWTAVRWENSFRFFGTWSRSGPSIGTKSRNREALHADCRSPGVPDTSWCGGAFDWGKVPVGKQYLQKCMYCINNINILAFGDQHFLRFGQDVVSLTMLKEGFDFWSLLKFEFDFLTLLEGEFDFCSDFSYVLSTSVCLSTHYTDYI